MGYKARTQSGQRLMQAAGGRWAGERLIAAINAGRPLSASELRTLDTLRKDEWKAFDEAVIEEASIRLRGISDLISAGLTRPVANALGKTLLEYEKVTDMDPAITSLDGLARSDNDRQTFELDAVPLPITHKDFNISLRTLSASREKGESLDTLQARTSSRLVAERLEYMLFNGGPTFGGKTIYGYTNHPNRNTGAFGTGGNWSQVAKTGEQMLDDVLTMIAAEEADRHHGPFVLYVGTGYALQLEADFKANSDKSIRQRLLEIDALQDIRTVDQMPADNMVLVQMTEDVVVLVTGEPIQTVQWDLYGGFAVAFKVWTIQTPLIRADVQGRSGIFHMS